MASIRLIGDGGLVGRLRALLPEAAPEAVQPIEPGDPDSPIEYAPGGARRAAFDAGEDPLPAWSTIAPRQTGWERDYQKPSSGNGPQDGAARVRTRRR